MSLIGVNGGLIGSRRSSDTGSAPGLWTPYEQVVLRRVQAWPISGDSYWSYNSLLLHMDGANGSTTFADSSEKNLTATANGNAQVSTTQSKFGGASGFFDGTGDFLSLTSPALNIGSSEDFTWEGWFYPTSLPGGTSYRALIHNDTAVSALPRLYIKGSSLLAYIDSNDRIFHQTPVVVNTWQHFAMVRASNVTYLYLDGVRSSTSYTYSAASSNNMRIGADSQNLAFAGYLDDVRITKGIARYTTTFTPASSAFVDVGTGADPYLPMTSLLLHMDGSNASTTFLDSSLNTLAVTAVGNAQISTAQSKFGGASGLFDGSGDYCTATLSALGTNDFTIEAWVRPSSFANYRMIYDTRTSDGDTSGFVWGINSSGNLFIYLGSFVLTTGTLTTNTWAHVALSRSGGTWRIFVNGVLQSGTYSNSGSLTRTATRIGMDWNTLYGFDGYIDDLRITNGVARYTSNFTPPVSALPDSSVTTDPYFPTTSLLLHMNGANGSTIFTDSSNEAVSNTVNGNAQISTAQSKFGGASGLFDGTGDYLVLPYSSRFNLAGVDFTIEAWVRFNVVGGVLLAKDTFGTGFDWSIDFPNATSIRMLTNNTNSNLTVTVPTLTTGVWYHVAFVRNSGTNRIYLDGIDRGNNTMAITNNITTNFTIGCASWNNPGSFFNGYVDDLRITRSVARYTANFTPPTAQFPDS